MVLVLVMVMVMVMVMLMLMLMLMMMAMMAIMMMMMAMMAIMMVMIVMLMVMMMTISIIIIILVIQSIQTRHKRERQCETQSGQRAVDLLPLLQGLLLDISSNKEDIVAAFLICVALFISADLICLTSIQSFIPCVTFQYLFDQATDRD